MNESHNSENSSRYQEYNSGKIESLLKGLNNINLGDKKQLTLADIQEFLNQYNSNFKTDNSLYEKLISVLEIQNSISLEDFLNGFIQFESELKNNNSELNNRLLIEQNNLNNLIEQCNKYKNEELNSEGFCKNSKLTIEIDNIELNQELQLQNIIIEIQYNDEAANKTINLTEDYNTIDKTVEFKPNKRSDNVIFTVKGVNPEDNELFVIGSRELPLTELTTQDEYNVQIDIPDNEDQETVALVITAKILLYWSDYQYFTSQKDDTETKIKKIESLILEGNKYLKDIDYIFKKNSKIDQPQYDSIQWNNQIVAPSTAVSNMNMFPGSISGENNEFQLHEKKLINTDSSDDKGIKIISMIILLLGLCHSFCRNEFHNIVGGLVFFLSCLKHYWIDSEEYIKLFKFCFYFCVALIGFDIIWIFNNTGFEYLKLYNLIDEKDYVVGMVSMGIVAVNLFLKGICSIKLYAQMKTYMNEN